MAVRPLPSVRSGGSSLLALLVLAALVPSVGADRPTVLVEDETNLSQSEAVYSERPIVAVTSDGTVHVVWEEGDNVVHRYRLNGTGQWSNRLMIFRQGYDPAVATDGSTIAVAFVRGKRASADDTEILYKMWDPESRKWPLLAEQVQSGEENIAADGQQPDIAFSVDSAYLWLSWIDTTWGERQPYYARIRLFDHAVDAGPIDSHTRNAQGPRIDVGPEDTVHVVWSKQSEYLPSSYIMHASRSAQARWDLDDYPYYREVKQARAPDIEVTQNQWCMAWHENIAVDVGGTPEPNNEVVLWCNESNWNISNSRDHSLVPSLTVDDERGQMVVWRENLTPRAIVFRQGPPPPDQGGFTVEEGVVDMPDVLYHDGHAHSVWSSGTEDGSDVWYGNWSVGVPTPTPTATLTPTRQASSTPTATGTGSPPAFLVYLPRLVVSD